MSKKTKLGVVSELKTAAYFEKRGYYVSKSLDPQAPFDLVITNDKGECALIDVKTISRRQTDSYQNKKGDKINRCPTKKQLEMNISIYDQET